MSAYTQYMINKTMWKMLKDLPMVQAKNNFWAVADFLYKRKYYFLAYQVYRKMVSKGYLSRKLLGIRTKRYGGRKRAAKYGKQKLATVSTVKRMINRSNETKFTYSAYTTLASNLLSTSPSFVLLNPLTQGDTDSNRTGDKVRFQYLTMTLSHNLVTNINDILYRYCIIRVKNPRGVAPTASTLVVNGATAQDPCEIWDEVNYDFYSRYEILFDSGVKSLRRYITTNYAVATEHISVACDFTTDYSLGNAGTIADIDQNALYLYFRTNNSTANAHALSYSYKLTYKDM